MRLFSFLKLPYRVYCKPVGIIDANGNISVRLLGKYLRADIFCAMSKI